MNQTSNLYQKLQAVQSQLKGLAKERENKFQKYKYVGEYDLLEAIKPLLTAQNLVLIITDKESEPLVREKTGNSWSVQFAKQATLINADEPTEFFIAHLWACAENTDLAKAKGSADTYAVKYFLQKFFLIPTDENLDPDILDNK